MAGAMKRHPFIIAPILLILACRPPLASIEGREINRITIKPPHYGKFKDHRTVVLTDPADIQFVVKNLSNMKARGFDHSQPVFDLQIETSSGQWVKLRVSDYEVGPDAPASANTTHWFPRDTKAFLAFYEFLTMKTQPPG